MANSHSSFTKDSKHILNIQMMIVNFKVKFNLN